MTVSRLPTGVTFLTILLVFASTFSFTSSAPAAEAIGEPLNRKAPTTLGKDLGFGKKYGLSMRRKFQDWGALSVSLSDGYPVRLGEKALRFETREGFCGDEPGWSDCRNGRSRHELTTGSGDRDSWNRDVWYSLSLYIPSGFATALNIKTSIFQFWAGGLDSWMFKYEQSRGFFVQRKTDHIETVIVDDNNVLDKWNDYIVRVRFSRKSDGIMTVWANGKKVYDYQGRTAAGNNSGEKPYFKFGIYNTAMGKDGRPIDGGGYANGAGMPNLHLFFDEVRNAANCKGLKLADLGYDCASLLN